MAVRGARLPRSFLKAEPAGVAPISEDLALRRHLTTQRALDEAIRLLGWADRFIEDQRRQITQLRLERDQLLRACKKPK